MFILVLNFIRFVKFCIDLVINVSVFVVIGDGEFRRKLGIVNDIDFRGYF